MSKATDTTPPSGGGFLGGDMELKEYMRKEKTRGRWQLRCKNRAKKYRLNIIINCGQIETIEVKTDPAVRYLIRERNKFSLACCLSKNYNEAAATLLQVMMIEKEIRDYTGGD